MAILAAQFDPDLLTVLGLIGFVGYMVSYGLVQGGRLDGNGISYTVLNLVSASLVLVSLITAFNLASALTQITWIVVSAAGLARHAQQRGSRYVGRTGRFGSLVRGRTRWGVAVLALAAAATALVAGGQTQGSAVAATRGVTEASVAAGHFRAAVLAPTAIVSSADAHPRWADIVPLTVSSSNPPRGTRLAPAAFVSSMPVGVIDDASRGPGPH